MTDIVKLSELKLLAKRYARANRIALHEALDLVAGQLNFGHWNGLITASKSKWSATAEDLAKVEDFLAKTQLPLEFRQANSQLLEQRFKSQCDAESGEIEGHCYRLSDAFGDVLMSGEGWSIHIPEAPHSAPSVETAGGLASTAPVHSRSFLQKALRIANARSEKVRAGISTDWPRRSSRPDLRGRVRHPLYGGKSHEWFCLHCRGMISGSQLAENLWHCPGCGSAPIDIFIVPFWLHEDAEKPAKVEVKNLPAGSEEEIEVVDRTLTFELDEAKIALLIRSALVEDASNANERLGALFANILVDEENDVWLLLDEDLWPEDKEPVQAFAVAELLGISVEVSMTAMTAPFAWPGLGKLTSSTKDYVQLVQEAYAQHGRGGNHG